jgi:hypothetical protein
MDYRYTEDFARQMASAEWRAHELRAPVLIPLWQAIARVVASTARSLKQRIVGCRRFILPEA